MLASNKGDFPNKRRRRNVFSPEVIAMRTLLPAVVLPFVLSAAAFGQSNWDRSYNVSGKAALSVEVDDASVRVTACGGCRTVHIHVEARGGDLSRFRVTDLQGGDGIHFALKHQDMSRSFFSGWHGRSPEIVIETPAETQLMIRSGNGALSVAGVRGGADLRTGNGAVSMSGVTGNLRATTGNGAIQITQADGSLVATTGDGSMNIDGRFSQFETHSGDGSIRLSLAPGSKLSASSRIATGDGAIALTLPRDLQAEISATSGGGNIANDLPLQVNTSAGRNSLHGAMNGGGPMLRIQSGDGSIALSTR